MKAHSELQLPTAIAASTVCAVCSAVTCTFAYQHNLQLPAYLPMGEDDGADGTDGPAANTLPVAVLNGVHL